MRPVVAFLFLTMQTRILLLGLTLSGVACATPALRSVEAPRPRTPPAAWVVGDTRGVELLARLVQLDTRQPSGQEETAARLLRDFLLRSGVDAELVPLSLGRASVIARVGGGAPADADPIILLSHLDTHPFASSAWPVDAGPLSATIRSDAIWGRGTVDGKGLAAVHALTLAVIQAAKVPLARPVVLVAAAGGLEADTPGLARVLAKHPDLSQAHLVITKGGGSIVDLLGDGRIVHGLASSERGHARAQLVATKRSDEQTEGSTAVRRLNRALLALSSQPVSPKLTGPTLEMLEFASVGVPFPKNLVMRTTSLARMFLLQDLAHRTSTRPLVTDEIEVVEVSSNRAGGRAVPDRAWAVLECRLLPGTSPGQLRGRLRGIIRDPDVHVVIEGSEWSESALDVELLAKLDARARLGSTTDQVSVPLMSSEPSGAKLLRGAGVRVYGYMPFVMTLDAWATAKGRDERLPLEQLRRGVRVLAEWTLDVAAVPVDGAAPATE